jgi:hypothetical protein
MITTSIPPREVEASWFSDLMGGIFTVITSPLLLIAKDNPTLRKNNPFRKKVWEEEEEKAERERDKEIIKRLSSHIDPPPQQVVIERETQVISEAAPNNFPEINELRNEVAAMKKDVADKTIEIEILQHIVSNVRNGKDGRDGADGKNGKDAELCYQFPEMKFPRGFDFVTEGNVTKIVMDNPTTNERDLRKFKAIAGVAIAVWAINKFFYVRPRIWTDHGDFIYEDRTTRLNVFMKTSATVFVGYFRHKFVNKKLTANELWTDAKDLTSEIGYGLRDTGVGIVHGVNWTWNGAKYITNATWNKLPEVNVTDKMWGAIKSVPREHWHILLISSAAFSVVFFSIAIYGMCIKTEKEIDLESSLVRTTAP